MLSVENIDVFYGDAQALDGVSIEVGEGAIVAIVGANGAGKTSLIRTIAGMNKPARGAIRYRGRIDNGYAELGKPRQHVTSHDLRASIDALLAGRQVPTPETDALGCYIADPAAIRGKP